MMYPLLDPPLSTLLSLLLLFFFLSTDNMGATCPNAVLTTPPLSFTGTLPHGQRQAC
jgi:hypothetical protein